MLDSLLHLMASFDLIGPILAIIQNIANGPSHTFLIPENCGWSGRQIDDLLKGHGIKTWGLMIISRKIRITVRLAQARWAQYLLDREGIPVAYGVVGSQVERAARSVQRQRKKRTNLFEILERWLDQFVDALSL